MYTCKLKTSSILQVELNLFDSSPNSSIAKFTNSGLSFSISLFIFIFVLFYFSIFLFLEQLGLGLIGHAVTSVTI